MKRNIITIMLIGLIVPSTAAFAATFAVGTSAGCTHATIKAALDAAATNMAGPHLIKLGQGFYTPAAATELPAAALKAINPLADIEIAGGYASCASSQPTPGQRATIFAPTNNQILIIYNETINPRRTVTLRALTLSGGHAVAPPLPGAHAMGGAVQIIGKATLRLRGATQISNSTAEYGGGIALGNSDVASSGDYAIMTLEEDSTIVNNTATGPSNHAGYGGGISADHGSSVILRDGVITQNQASFGGGIYLRGNFGSTVDSFLSIAPTGPADAQVEISNNSASDYQDQFGVSAHGYGGGIFSLKGEIDSIGHDGDWSLVMRDNLAWTGGAIAVIGDPTVAADFTFIDLRNALLESNIADDIGGAMYSDGAVDWVLNSDSHVPCIHDTLGAVPCSLANANVARNQSTGTLGGGVIYLAKTNPDAARGIARFRRTAMIGNQSQNGSVAVGMAEADNDFFFERNILAGNSASAPNSVLLRSAGPMRCFYCTVTGNPVAYLFHFTGETLLLQGSILWNPGAAIRYQTGPLVQTSGCLIAHTATGLPTSTTVADPHLAANFVPAVPSVALDHCDNVVYTAIPDAYNQAPTDIAGVTNLPYGLNDLGAIEQVDVIFYGGFGLRPTD